MYLKHIRDCADRILEYTGGGREMFFADPKTQDAVMRNLEIVGEAAKNLSDELRAAHAHIPWKRIAGMRDVLIHNYFGVQLGTVWTVTQESIPELREQVAAILSVLGGD